MMIGLAAALALELAAAPAAPTAVSTAAYQVQVSSDAVFIDGLKRRIAEDQRQVLKARSSLKSSRARGGEAAIRRASRAWQESKAKLKADRQSLRLSIESREKESEKARRRRR